MQLAADLQCFTWDTELCEPLKSVLKLDTVSASPEDVNKKHSAEFQTTKCPLLPETTRRA